jgi:hypothetical protein
VSTPPDPDDFVRRAHAELDELARDERWRASAQMLREGITQLVQTGEDRWQAIERLAPAAKALRLRSQHLEKLLDELRGVFETHAPTGMSRAQVEACSSLIASALRHGP